MFFLHHDWHSMNSRKKSILMNQQGKKSSFQKHEYVSQIMTKAYHHGKNHPFQQIIPTMGTHNLHF